MRSIDDDLDYQKILAVFDKYTRPGARAGGVVTEKPVIRAVTVMGSGEVRTFNDGSPMEQYVITVQTETRDASNPDDDGRRRIYVKGRNKNRFKEAVRAAGLKTVSEGDAVTVTYVREEPIPGTSFTTKIHTYEVIPGPNAVRVGDKTATPARAAAPAELDEPPF
jgi:hypothetical protein